jgi:GNAT superfamily N-acetyltransferase
MNFSCQIVSKALVDNPDEIESSIAAIQKSIGWDCADLRIASRRLRDSKDIKILASSQTGLIGYAILVRRENDHLYVSQLAVSRGDQGRGVGKSIMNKIFEEAKRLKATTISLETEGEDERLLKFYRTSGTSDFEIQIEPKGKDRFAKKKSSVKYILSEKGKIISALETIAEIKEISFENFSRQVNQTLRGIWLTIETASAFFFRIKKINRFLFETVKLQNLFFDHVSMGFLVKSPETQFELAKEANQSFPLARHYLRLGYQDAFWIVYNQWDNLNLNKEQRYAIYDEMGIYGGATQLFDKLDLDEKTYLCKKILLRTGFWALEKIIDHNGLEGINVNERHELIQKGLREFTNPAVRMLAKHINQIGLKTLPIDDRVALCKEMLKTSSTAEYGKELCEFALNELTSEQRVAFFDEIVTNVNALHIVGHYEKFGLEEISLEQRIMLYKSIFDKKDKAFYAVNRFHEKWEFEKEIVKIADPSERLAFISRIIGINIYIGTKFVENLDQLNLHEAMLLDRFDLCRLLQEPSMFKSLGFLDELTHLPSISHRLAFCKQMAESAGNVAVGIIDHFHDIGLDHANEDDLIDLWRKIAFSSMEGAFNAVTNFEMFRINCEETRLELCKEAFNRFSNVFREIINSNTFASLGLSHERILILLAQEFSQRGRPKDLDEETVLRNIQSDATKRQMYLELLRPPSTMKDESTSNFSQAFPEPVNSILPIIKIKEGVPLEKDALEHFMAFVMSTPKLRVLVPFLEDILKKDEHLQYVLLEWIAYTAGVLHDLPDERILPIEKLGILKDIYEHHNRVNRFIFTSLFRYQEFYSEISLRQSWGRLSAGLVSIFERGIAIELLSIIDNTKFKDPKRFNSLVHLLHEVTTIGKTFNEKQLHLIAAKIKTVLSHRGKKAKKGVVKQKRIIETISETFDSYTNIIKIFGKSEFLRCLELETDPQAFFLDNFQSLFTIQDIQNFAEQYQNTFAKFRNPMALFSYLRSINSLPNGERLRMHQVLNAYVNAVLQGKFPNIRYNPDQSEHVKKVFSALDKTDWTGSAKSFEFKTGKSETIVDFRNFFVEKIVRDQHVNPKSLPRLVAYLDNQPTCLVESDKELDMFQNFAIQLCERQISTEIFVLNVKRMTFFGADFRNDLATLIPQLSSGTYSICETDDACDLLLIGTEIKGSCQRVDGTPNLNKGLMSYLMNGEIRAIVVKKEGKIVARSIIRLLWDSEKNIPVILLERIYSNFQEEIIKEMIIRWAQNKAKGMDLPLLSVEVKSNNSAPYQGAISFLGGYAPFTYCDALRGMQSGPFTIASSFELRSE